MTTASAFLTRGASDTLFRTPQSVTPSESPDERVLHPGWGDTKAWDAAVDELLRYRMYDEDWDGNGAAAIPPELVDSAIRLCTRFRRDGLPPPSCVLPGVNGTVVLEWTTPGERLKVEVIEPNLAEALRSFSGEPIRMIQWRFGQP